MEIKMLAIDLVGTAHERKAVVDVRLVRVSSGWLWYAEGKSPKDGKRFERSGKKSDRFDAEREMNEAAAFILDDLIANDKPMAKAKKAR